MSVNGAIFAPQRNRRPRPEPSKHGFVYFIEREPGDYVKIGWAKHGPHVRICELQTGCPDLLYVRAYFEGTRDDERKMHETFRCLRGRGEWFANVLKLADFLNYLDDANGERPATEDEIVTALGDCVLGGTWHPDLAVKESTYDESADWRPWGDLLHAYDMVDLA
jgi:hypothetical protein